MRDESIKEAFLQKIREDVDKMKLPEFTADSSEYHVVEGL